jgi:hypothetical protein
MDAVDSTSAVLTGQVLIGPTCPVAAIDDNGVGVCADRPFAAILSIKTQDDTLEVARVATDDQGLFSTTLAPGTYRIFPLTLTGHALPRGVPATVTLEPGSVTTLDLHVDSGIR